MASLTLAVMVRDEEVRIKRCIESARGAFDEVRVLDTGSKDDTVAVARAAGAVVSEMEWPGSFSAGMNALLDQIDTDWVLRLDSDEWFEVDPKDALQEAMQSAEGYGYKIVMRDLLPEGGHREFSIFRMWRNHPLMRYEGMVHENIPNERIAEAFPGMRVETLPAVWVWHDGYLKGSEGKVRRNLDLLEAELAKRPDNPYYQAMRGLMYRDLGDPRGTAELRSLAESSLEMPEPSSRMLASVYAAILQDAPERPDPVIDPVIQKVWQWFGNYPGVLWATGLAEVKRGNLQGALKAYLRLEKLSETGAYERSLAFPAAILGAHLWNALGYVAQQLGRMDIVERCAGKLQKTR